jgi:hypothetical protein
MATRDDHATLIDSLERIPLVTRLAAAVMTCTPPRVFGVHGDWGAGKTSFLHQLHFLLDGLSARKTWADEQKHLLASVRAKHPNWAFPTQTIEEDALVIWFEAWRYQHEPAPVVPLIHEIRGQLGPLVRATNWGKKIAEVTVRSGLLQLEQIAKFAWLQSAAAITVASKGSGLAATVQEQGERWEREHLAEKLPAETLREQLEHAVEQLLGRSRKAEEGARRRLVVLIDDLDRCEPQATYRLLEGIKIYLNIPNCVFVLGMDQRIIEEAIAESAPGAKDSPKVARRRAREYLEKLFQEVYHLPIVEFVPAHVMAWLPEDEDALTEVPKAVRDKLNNVLDLYPECIPANPRKIKAFAAVLWRFLTEPDKTDVAGAGFAPLDNYPEPAGKNPYESLVLILASLYHFHPEIYRVLEAHDEAFYDRLWKWCAQSEKQPDDHASVIDLERAFTVQAPANAGMAKLPGMNSMHGDYSRGNILRIQRLVYDARPFTRNQIRALLLK